MRVASPVTCDNNNNSNNKHNNNKHNINNKRQERKKTTKNNMQQETTYSKDNIRLYFTAGAYIVPLGKKWLYSLEMIYYRMNV